MRLLQEFTGDGFSALISLFQSLSNISLKAFVQLSIEVQIVEMSIPTSRVGALYALLQKAYAVCQRPRRSVPLRLVWPMCGRGSARSPRL